ncbi:MAG: O-antigen polymerase [Novosphingobium sp.]
MYEITLAANVFLWLAITLYYIRLPIASAFHPVSYYLFFHGFIFTFRPIVIYINQYTDLYNGYGFSPSQQDKITVMLATMLGLVCFVGTALRTGTAPIRFAQDRFIDLEREQLIKPYLFVAGLFTPLGVISALARWSTRANDSSDMVLDAATGSFINTTSTGYFDDLQILLAPLAVMLIWFYRFKWWTFIPFAVFIVLRGGTGGRWPILMACASVALMFLYQNRQKLPNIRASVLVVVALWLFQVVGSDRGAAIRKLFIDENSLSYINYNRKELGFLESMDFANLEFFEYIVYVVPQRSGTFGYFLNNLQIFTEPIPRILWEGKPVGAPIKLFSLFDYGYPIGMTYSLPGEGWMQLGFIGVIIWCSLFGWFYGWVYNKFQRSKQSTLAIIAFALFTPLSLQFFRDGLLLTLVKTHAWFLMPIVLTYGFARISAVPLADDLRLMAMRRIARKPRAIGTRLARLAPAARPPRRGVQSRRSGWPTE